jgi:polyisoprenoid-binding protein YceI
MAVTSLDAQNLNVRGKISFTSTAPQELITAKSTKLTGLLNPNELSFAFVVDINSFDGFNSPLQRVHFNENYMETTKFPKSRFYGRIIENVNLDELVEEKIRAKGYLEVHGIKKERIIQVTLRKRNGVIYFVSDFSLSLSDYKISIPRIVHQKLSDQIQVHVEGTINK